MSNYNFERGIKGEDIFVIIISALLITGVIGFFMFMVSTVTNKPNYDYSQAKCVYVKTCSMCNYDYSLAKCIPPK